MLLRTSGNLVLDAMMPELRLKLADVFLGIANNIFDKVPLSQLLRDWSAAEPFPHPLQARSLPDLAQYWTDINCCRNLNFIPDNNMNVLLINTYVPIEISFTYGPIHWQLPKLLKSSPGITCFVSWQINIASFVGTALLMSMDTFCNRLKSILRITNRGNNFVHAHRQICNQAANKFVL